MVYNDGKVHIDFYDKNSNYEEIAEQFSEGDPQLKRVLLELWKNNIRTVACCRGHSDKEIPYITLIIDNNSRKLIKETSKYLYTQVDGMGLDFVHYDDEEYDTVTINMVSQKDKNEYFNFLHNYLNFCYEINEPSNDIMTYADYLLKFARESGLNCRYFVDEAKMLFAFKPKKYWTYFDEDKAPLLKDKLVLISETKTFPLATMKCDSRSLEQFINLLYPGSFEKQNSIQK